MSKLVVGIVGKNGSGKGTFVQALRKAYPALPFIDIRFGDILLETLQLWKIHPTRANLQKLFLVMEQGFGAAILSTATKHRIENINSPLVIIEGMRRHTDLATLKSFNPNLMVHIFTEGALRYERMKIRNEKLGENTMTWEQFLDLEASPAESEITAISDRADKLIHNNGTLESFEQRVREFYETHMKALL